MIPTGGAIAYTLFIWWFSTGAILFLDGLPRSTFRWSLLAATLLLAGALVELAVSAQQATARGAYAAFTCSIIAWGWVEMSFLMGYLTGPRRTACPADVTGWRRFQVAIQAILHHELALIGGASLIAAISWNSPNRTGLWVFLILWALRESAKLNIFLGVRNLSEQFLPEHLRYLQTYFRRKPMNLLFPFSVTASSVVAARLWTIALAAEKASFIRTEYSFLATLLTLAVLEHWFLVIPIPADALWSWGMGSRSITTSPVRAGETGQSAALPEGIMRSSRAELLSDALRAETA